jgi:DNA polymerase-3 subunit beta
LESIGKTINLTATDLEMTIKCSISDIDVDEQGSITIPAKKFIDIIRELPNSEVKINIDEKNLINIRCDKISYKIMGLPKSDFPPIIEPKKEAIQLKLNQGMFKDMIKKTIFAVSPDESRKTLTGVYFILEEGNIKLVGTDGHRLAFIKNSIGKSDKTAKIIIPTKVLNELVKIMGEDNDIEISILDNQIIFKLKDIVISSRLIEGQYASYEQIINRVFDKKVRVNRENLLKAVKRVSLLAVDKVNAVKIKTEESKLLMSATAIDIGEAEEEIDAEYKGEEAAIAFNSKYVMDVLKVLEKESVDIELKDSASAGLIKSVGEDNYLYILMPIRI